MSARRIAARLGASTAGKWAVSVGGFVAGIVGAVSMRRADVRRRAAGRELRESERRFRVLADSMPQIAWNANASGEVEYANRQWMRYIGAERPGEALGWAWLHAVHPADLARVMEVSKRAIETGAILEVEHRFRRHDGVYRWFLTRAVPLRDAGGRVVSWYGTATDIHDLREAREALALSEERFRTALFASPVIVFNQDLELRYTWMHNPGPIFADVIGLRDGDICARRDEGDAVEAVKRTVLETGQGTRTLVWVTRPEELGGDRREFDLSVEPLRKDGEIVGITGAAIDVTERRREEAALRQAQKLELLGGLAGGIAHDFNNLLTGILGNASLAIDSLSLESRAVVAPLIEEVMCDAERAAALTRQLLAYAGKADRYVEPLDLGRVIQSMAPLLETSIGQNVALGIEVSPGAPKVMADAGQIRQIVMNFVANGAEAIGDALGEVEVTVDRCDLDRDEVRLYPGYELCPGAYVCLEVRDTGAGMDEETLRCLFDPFFTTKFQGRGLGLSSVDGIVRSCAGAIRVLSERGRGTTFRVVFPACE